MFKDLFRPEIKVAEPKTKQRKTAASSTSGNVSNEPPPASQIFPSRKVTKVDCSGERLTCV
jgi:hypothetical protein